MYCMIKDFPKYILIYKNFLILNLRYFLQKLIYNIKKLNIKNNEYIKNKN